MPARGGCGCGWIGTRPPCAWRSATTVAARQLRAGTPGTVWPACASGSRRAVVRCTRAWARAVSASGSPRRCRSRRGARRRRPRMAERAEVIRVLVVDDQALVRSGFTMILDAQPDITVVGEAADGAQAIGAAAALDPDVVLMDVRMPGMDGIEATAAICAQTRARVLVLTTFDLDEYVYDALRAGASGFLLKDMRRQDLVDAVRVIAAGEALLAPTVTRRLIAAVVGRPRSAAASDRRAAARLGGLTARETDTLRQLARGL